MTDGTYRDRRDNQVSRYCSKQNIHIRYFFVVARATAVYELQNDTENTKISGVLKNNLKKNERDRWDMIFETFGNPDLYNHITTKLCMVRRKDVYH